MKPAVKNAFILGGMCSLSYLAVYIARNILGAVTPGMIESGSFSTELIGGLSSFYFVTYAVGQLINGIIGDKIKAKYMISFGLILAGVCNFLFSLAGGSPLFSYISYGLTGFFLSMIYGPMTKLVAENTEPIYATRCSIGYTFASFVGTPMAGLFAMFLAWKGVFAISSATLIGMGLICFLAFELMERKGILRYGQYRPRNEEGKAGGIKLLIKYRIIRFSFISAITGVIRTSVVFWLPTYFSQRLGFSTEKAAFLFTLASILLSCCIFAAIFLYEKLRYNMELAMLIFMSLSAITFLGAWCVEERITNAILITIAIFSADCTASLLWSRYCPSLRDTGMVSSATGFLDFLSYMAAAAASALFANAVGTIGWGNLVLVWTGLSILGILCTIEFKKKKQ